MILLQKWGRTSPASLNEADGFSTLAPILFSLESTVLLSDLVPYTNIALSLLQNSTTLLIDTSTGEYVPHWVDRDDYELEFGSDGSPPALIMQVHNIAKGLHYHPHFYI